MLGLDGGAVDAHGGSAALSSEGDRARMEQIRSRADAVLVGAATIRDENPALGVRSGSRPRPVVLTATGELDPKSRIFAEEEVRPMILVTPEGEPAARALDAVADVAVLPPGPDVVPPVLERLEAEGVERLLVEGGPSVVRRFVRAGKVDEVHLTLSPRLGAAPSRRLDADVLDELLALRLVEQERDGDFLFLRYERDRS